MRVFHVAPYNHRHTTMLTKPDGAGQDTQPDNDNLQPDTCTTSPPQTPQRPVASPHKRGLDGAAILIVCGGTRGDVEPAAALAVVLCKMGARVRLAADASFCSFIQRRAVSVAGPGTLEFYPLGGSAVEMMALTVKWGGMLPNDGLSGIAWVRQHVWATMASVWSAATGPSGPISEQHGSSTKAGASLEDTAAFRPDIILCNQLAYGAPHVAERLGVPLHVLLTIPWLPTQHFPHPWARAFGRCITAHAADATRLVLAPLLGAVRLLRGPGAAARLQGAVLRRVLAATNWASTPLLDGTAWLGIADLHARFRHQLGLPVAACLWSATARSAATLYRHHTTCLFSPLLVPRPPDWPPHVTLSGFLSLAEAADRFGGRSCGDAGGGCDGDAGGGRQQLPAALTKFLGSGPPPLYFGLGSVVLAPVTAATLVPAAIRHLLLLASAAGMRVRVVVGSMGSARGGAAAAGAGAPAAGGKGMLDDEDVLVVGDVPHDLLLPRCSALVHHGGVGTMAAGLRHAKPQLCLPCFGDLHFWAHAVHHQLGVGPAPLPIQGATPHALGAAMHSLLQGLPLYTARAAAVAASLAREDGLTAAAASVCASLGCRKGSC